MTTTPHKPLALATVLEKNKVASLIPFLLLIEVDVVDPTSQQLIETLRIANNTEDVTFNGQVYTAAKFDIQLKEESGAQPEVTLSLVDYTRAVLQRMETYGGGVGFKVTLLVVRGDTATMASDKPETRLFFEVVGASASSYVVSFTLGAENALMRLFPRRLQAKNFCPWRYKDPTTCRYASSLPGCDLTLAGPNGCKAHGNERNFGGFPGINNAGTHYY